MHKYIFVCLRIDDIWKVTESPNGCMMCHDDFRQCAQALLPDLRMVIEKRLFVIKENPVGNRMDFNLSYVFSLSRKQFFFFSDIVKREFPLNNLSYPVCSPHCFPSALKMSPCFYLCKMSTCALVQGLYKYQAKESMNRVAPGGFWSCFNLLSCGWQQQFQVSLSHFIFWSD